MGRQRHTAEQIVAKLREAEVLQGKGMALKGSSVIASEGRLDSQARLSDIGLNES